MTTTPKERPILFNADMVRAILDGRKTQTRRVVKPDMRPGNDARWLSPGTFLPGPMKYPVNGKIETISERITTQWELWSLNPDRSLYAVLGKWDCPFGVPGDHLWVQENYLPSHPHFAGQGEVILRHRYRADANPKAFAPAKGWTKASRMPREHSRITLEITNVRVERVQDITEDDAKAEGIRQNQTGKYFCGAPHKAHGFPRMHNTAKEAFSDLWDAINAKRGFGWDVNPFVWAIEFKRIEP